MTVEYLLFFPEAFTIFRWGYSGLLFKHSAQVLGIFKSKFVGNLGDICPVCEFILCTLDNILADVVTSGVARGFSD